MSEWLENRTFAILLFVSWLPLAAYLFPLPSESYAIETGKKVTRMMESSDIVGTKFRLMRSQVKEIHDFYGNPGELHNWIMLRWGAYFIIILTGLLAALLAIFQHQFWKIAVITASGCYLLFIIGYSGVYLPSKLDARSWLMVVSQLNENGLLIYRELVFPVMQFILAIILFFNASRHYSQDFSEESELRPNI